MAPARSRCLDKLVDHSRLRSVDNLQQKNEHHPLEEGRGVRKGGQDFSLAKQVGVGLGKQVDPCNLIVVPALDSGEDEAKEVLVVEEPMGMENIEDVEDTRVLERSYPALGHQPYATRRRQTGRLGGGRACSADSLAN